jgi:hypothetical protein
VRFSVAAASAELVLLLQKKETSPVKTLGNKDFRIWAAFATEPDGTLRYKGW